MLMKLLKYEFKSTARIFIPIYIAILVLSFLTSITLSNPTSNEILSIIFPSVYALTLAGLFIMTLIMVVKRFDTNLLSDEGYLMFTLPVKISDLINSKIIIPVLWAFSSFIIFIISMIIVFIKEIDFTQILDSINELFNTVPYAGLMIFLGITILILSYINLLLKIYASLGIAQAYSITGNRILGGVLVYIGVAIVLNVIQTFVMFFLQKSEWFMNLMESIEKFFSNINMTQDAMFVIVIILLVIALIVLISNVLFYLLTHYFLKNKLNLE